MCFENFLNEIAVANVELQTSDIRADAKTIIAKTRGLMPGRVIDANGDSATSNQQGGSDAFTPDNPRARPGTGTTQEDDKIADMFMILKNNATEVVFISKDANKNIFITIVNKQKVTKRTIAIEPRGATLLKRFI